MHFRFTPQQYSASEYIKCQRNQLNPVWDDAFQVQLRGLSVEVLFDQYSKLK